MTKPLSLLFKPPPFMHHPPNTLTTIPCIYLPPISQLGAQGGGRGPTPGPHPPPAGRGAVAQPRGGYKTRQDKRISHPAAPADGPSSHSALGPDKTPNTPATKSGDVDCCLEHPPALRRR
jgi:hypothetical protein